MGAELRADVPPPPGQGGEAPTGGRAETDEGDNTLFDAALEQERAALQALFPLPPARSTGRRAARATATTAVLLAAAAALVWIDPVWHAEYLVTAPAEQRAFALRDGSKVILDAATRLQVQWRLRSRQTFLEAGRAHFDVAHAALRPFVVTAGRWKVRAVGTAFDVARSGDAADVVLYSGVVRVGRVGGSGPSQTLMPGQVLHAGAGSALAPQPADVAAAQAWHRGQSVFDRTPLREVLAQLQRYRNAPIRLRDDGALGQTLITGVIDTHDLDAWLDRLPHVAPVRVLHAADGAVTVQPLHSAQR